MSQYTTIYLITVGLFGPLLILLLTTWIKRVRNNRRQNLKERRVMDPILTNSPVDHPVRTLKEEALDSINTRFSIIETTVILVGVVLWLFLMIIPMLNYLPATIISIFAASVAVITGILAKPFIENFISGVIISFAQPFRIGDTVLIDGQYGTIEDITMTNTIMKLWDWRRFVLPNSKMLNTEFTNYSLHDNFVWAKVEFWVSYQTNLEEVKKYAVQIARQSPFFAKTEEPSFWVMEMAQQGYRCWLAAWADSPSDAWELGNDVRSGLILKFQLADIKAHSFHVDMESTQPTTNHHPPYEPMDSERQKGPDHRVDQRDWPRRRPRAGNPGRRRFH